MPTTPTESPERLSFDDAQILQLESAAICGHTCKLAEVESDHSGEPLSAAALRERIGERVGAMPRLQERVVIPEGRHELPYWELDADFDIANHICAHECDGPLDDSSFRELVGEVMSERLDHERPLWRVDVVPLEGGRTGLIGRVHHCMADGVSVMRVLAGMLWDPVEPAPEPASGPAAPAPASAKPEPAKPAPKPHTLSKLPGTFSRELRPAATSALDQHIGSDREVAWTSTTLSELKRIGHAAGDGVTVNDVILAAICGSLREWLSLEGVAPEQLRAQVPVSLHSRDEGADQIGNRDSFLSVDLPLGEADPLARLRSINEQTKERKLDHDAETLYAFFHALSHFKPLYNEVTRLTSGPREFALSISNVPGPRQAVTVLGRPVSRFCSFAEPADRHALRIAAVSLADEVAFGFCSDPAALSSLALLADALDASLAELGAAV